ncbi:MAG TPA: NADH:flavin oxidoreductase [Gammaproteobacteria bacterium]|nr:NADH:flavin oxidoreductase [Gammaproteobacteria bacterium]
MSLLDSVIFKPFSSEKLSLSNRIVMAPMTRNFSPNGVPGDDVAAYYRRRAEGGTGLIITEGTTVNHKVASMDPNIPRIHGDDAMAGWRKVVSEVHDAGGKIMPQLWHVGTARPKGAMPNSEEESQGPSGLVAPGVKKAATMTEEDIADVIQAFADAAADAKAVGFDGIELHGAHGYLIDQFFWQGTNQRADAFGGDMKARSLFAEEIVKNVRKAVGQAFPIIFRYSQWKQQDFEVKIASDVAALESFLGNLADAGVDLFHASTRRFWEPEFAGSELNLAGWTKQITNKPTISVGSVGLNQEFITTFAGGSAEPDAEGIERLVTRMEAEEFDLIAVGRALLVDPAWANKVKHGKFDEIQAYTQEAMASLS